MRVTHAFIDEIKYRNRIEDVISSYVNLKKAGSNRVGLCPFHSEKTPSFTVFSSTDTFHCFGCGAGGDVISFIMRAENLDYMSSLEYLAKRAGMQMPRDDDIPRQEGLSRARLLEMNKEAARFYNKLLMTPGNPGMEYLHRRQLSDSTVKHFGLGYAPDGFSALREHMNKLGYTDEELKTAFLCGKSEKNGKYYDYFRNRVIFPIIDNFGNIIAFGGRAIGDAMPKYLNTSDTPAFKKSRNLFSLNFARTCCSEYLILCEGYMDVISVNAGGFANAVATLGTALTQEQARIMAKYTKRVIIAYDSDSAGQSASKRAIPILDEAGLDAKVLNMTGAKDPDEYIKKFGADSFRTLIEKSKSKLDFLCDTVLGKYNILIPEEKVRAASELCDMISEVGSDVEREIYITKISERLSLDAVNVKSDVERARKRKKRREEAELSHKVMSDTLGYGDRVNPEYMTDVKSAKAEEAILGIMLISPELTDKIRTGKIKLTAEDFVTSFNKKVFSEIISCELDAGEKFDIGFLGGTFGLDEISRITAMQVKRTELSGNSEQALEENIAVLKDKRASAASDDPMENLLALIENKKNKNKK